MNDMQCNLNVFKSSPLAVWSWLDLAWNCIPPETQDEFPLSSKKKQGKLRLCFLGLRLNSPQPPQQAMYRQPPAKQGTWSRTQRTSDGATERSQKAPETNVCVITYVSVLTVSSFRPTTGRSMSRSRRLVQGDKL